jgi:hypothetical protein
VLGIAYPSMPAQWRAIAANSSILTQTRQFSHRLVNSHTDSSILTWLKAKELPVQSTAMMMLRANLYLTMHGAAYRKTRVCARLSVRKLLPFYCINDDD